MKRACLLVCLFALAACGKADNDPGPGGVTVGEAKALDQAAAMLDARRPPAEALESSTAQWPQSDASEAAEQP
ncbi:hypothetical protein [Novosphingobium malaysiense]|uniref:Lipoprotein n=1 Tax=Novosphingobium malaysiense TaxID=1348853 RepID=A0A0B1ZMN4_9SPHN|nr:hypothetical protein [Novosphingobium malaysiense]KHK92400.1 hypothetical protein LK12_06220 [Novosphingobium malaysiense]